MIILISNVPRSYLVHMFGRNRKECLHEGKRSYYFSSVWPDSSIIPLVDIASKKGI